VPPAAATWTAIRVRLGFDGAAPAATARRGFGAGWRIAFAVTITAVALALGWLVYRDARLETVPVATLRAEGGPDLWHVELDRDTTRLAVRVAQATPAPAGKSYELWALPAGAAPVSLGLLPVAGDIERRLEPAQRSALEAASKVAVSLEPAGGSQTGAPTGPVLYVAEIDRAAG
jgi:anti-sigma-K factor RskA